MTENDFNNLLLKYYAGDGGYQNDLLALKQSQMDPRKALMFGETDQALPPAGLPIGQTVGTKAAVDVAKGLADASDLTRQAMQGELPLDYFHSDEGIGRALNAAGIGMAGGVAGVPARAGQTVLGSGPIRNHLETNLGKTKTEPQMSVKPAERAENLAKFKSENVEDVPPIVYHGTGNDIHQFDTTKGAWFTDTPSLASEYANKPGGNVVPAHIALKNPIEFVHAEQRKPIGEVISTALSGAHDLSAEQINAAKPIVNILRERYGKNARPLFEYWNNDPDITKLFKTLGYDGISVFEKADRKAKTWSIFSPEQAKSAIGNAGTFNPKSPKLNEARGGAVKGYALGGQADIAQANIDLLNEMARRYNLTAGDGSVAADAQSQAAIDRYAEMVSAMNTGVTRGDNTSQQTPTSTNFTTNTPATVAYDPRANDMVPYSNANYQPGAVQSYNLSNLSPSQQAAVITSSQTSPTSTQTAATTPTTNANVAVLPSTIEGFAPSSRGVGNLVSPGFTESGKVASRAGEALPGYLGPLQQAFVDESKALMGAYGTLPSSVTNVAIPPEQLDDWLAVQQEMFGDERAAAINQGIINGDLSLFGEGQTPNVGAPQENFNGAVAGQNLTGTFDPLASNDVLGDVNYGAFGLSGPMGLSNAIQEMQDQQDQQEAEQAAAEQAAAEQAAAAEAENAGGGDAPEGGDGDYALGGTVNKDLMKLYRKYSKKSRKYAQGGPVAVYDPAEIDAIAARIREGNYA